MGDVWKENERENKKDKGERKGSEKDSRRNRGEQEKLWSDFQSNCFKNIYLKKVKSFCKLLGWSFKMKEAERERKKP